jgi:hypothetical protein
MEGRTGGHMGDQSSQRKGTKAKEDMIAPPFQESGAS